MLTLNLGISPNMNKPEYVVTNVRSMCGVEVTLVRWGMALEY